MNTAGGRGGRGGRGSYDNHGGRGGYDDNRGGRGGRGGYDDNRGGRGGRGGYDDNHGGRGGRGGYDDNRGGRGGYDDNRGGRGGYDRHDNRGNRDDNRGYGSNSRGPPPPVGGMGPTSILPPKSSGGKGGQVSEEKLKLRANNMRIEWIEDPNEKELIMSIDEVLSTPNAAKTIVQVNIDYCADCKQSELGKIVEMICVLVKKQKLSPSDVVPAMTDMVEFSDSFMHDNPRIFDYVGDMFAQFANINILSVDWLCDATAKVNEESCKPKLIEGVMDGLKKAYGDKAVQGCFGGASESRAVGKVLGAAKAQEIYTARGI